MPSPTAPAGLVVRSQSAAAPPVASRVARAEIAPPSVVTPTQRNPSTRARDASPSTNRDPRVVEDALGERVRDLRPVRRAARVHDTGARMSAFEPEAEVELDSQIGEVGDARGASLGEDGDGARAAEPAARRDRVLGVQSRIVVRRRPRRRLRPARGSSQSS